MITKRKRERDEAYLPSKRLAIDTDATADETITCGLELDEQSSIASVTNFDDGLDGSLDGNSTPPSTIATIKPAHGQSAAPPPSTSTARKVFPSMLKTIKCTFSGCDKTFNRPARLAAHLRTHTGDRALRCPHDGCDKAYFDEKHLQQHIKGSHSTERQYACPEPGCGKTFLTGTRLRRHAVVHSGEGRFRCTGYDGCDKIFRKHQTLQRHVRADHLGQSAFVCTHDNCDAGFDTANALRKHVQREHGELRFWCEECGKEDGEAGRRTGFTTMGLLNAHMRTCHVDCMFCESRCASQWELERHIEMHHSGSTTSDRKTVSCTWKNCDKKFTRKANLNVHIRMVHEGYRFVCGDFDLSEVSDLASWDRVGDGCGNGFASKKKLEDHVRVAHLGMQKPPRTVRINHESPIKSAGLFNMYASAEQLIPQPEAFSNTAQPGLDLCSRFPCGFPACSQGFGTAEERDAHAVAFHLGQDRSQKISTSDAQWNDWNSMVDYHTSAEPTSGNVAADVIFDCQGSEPLNIFDAGSGDIDHGLEALVDPSLFLN
ncbi:hypothetical protein PspLS_01991 [Pyricularia sp. CBS 133598]|nr:hypothetical protein PspLS_01991 [Pyricularia sp. CBS 133598]